MTKERTETKNAYQVSIYVLEKALGLTDNGIPLADSAKAIIEEVKKASIESMTRFNPLRGEVMSSTFADLGFLITGHIRNTSDAISIENITGNTYRQCLDIVKRCVTDLKDAERLTESYMK